MNTKTLKTMYAVINLRDDPSFLRSLRPSSDTLIQEVTRSPIRPLYPPEYTAKIHKSKMKGGLTLVPFKVHYEIMGTFWNIW